jgi:hypothetical protein
MVDEKNRYFERFLVLIKTTTDDDEKQIEIEREKISEQKKHHLSSENEDNFDDYLADLANEAYEMKQMMHRSFVVSVFLFMESRISSLCDHVFKETRQKLNYRDLPGAGVIRSVRYLEKILDITFIPDLRLREEFEVARIIRNSIVHNGGVVDKDDKTKIEKYMKQYPNRLDFYDYTISIKYDYLRALFILNSNICDEVSKNWKEFFGDS